MQQRKRFNDPLQKSASHASIGSIHDSQAASAYASYLGMQTTKGQDT